MMDMGSEITSLEDEMQEFNFEKSVKNNLKTQEELDKLTVDESFNDLERATYIISSGQEVQYVSVLRNLPHLLKLWPTECIRRLVPKIKDMLHTSNNEIQLTAADVFVKVIHDDLVPYAQYTQHFLRTIITNMDVRDAVIAKAWHETLLNVIQFLPREIIKREILGLAIAKGQLSQPTPSRISCCAILGALAIKFDANVLKKDVVHAVKQLCQDVDFEVRTSMCSNLYKVAKGLGQEETRRVILDEILELASDEESSVREAALEAVLNMTQLLDAGTLKEHIVPLMCSFTEHAIDNEETTMPSVVQNFGKICTLLSDNITSEQRSWFLTYFRYLCVIGSPPTENTTNDTATPDVQLRNDSLRGEIRRMSRGSDGLHNDTYPRSPSQQIPPEKKQLYLECRRACSYNLPAMVLFAGSGAYKTELMDSLSFLAHEADTNARKHVAAGLHEVAEILNEESFLVHLDLISLLREKQSVVVLDALMKHLTDTIQVIFNKGGYGLSEYKPNATAELISAFLAAISRLEQQWSSSWRTMEAIVTHMQNTPDVLTSDQIYYKFVPIIFKIIMNNRYLPVREAAVCTACIFIRHNRKQEQRKEMCNRLVKDLCYGEKYRSRILFFTACYKMMSLFSRSFVKEHLFEHVMNLFHDPVPNVRLALCKILPSLKSLLKLPRDRALHQQLESNVRRMLSSENDRDVSTAIRLAIFELDRTEVAMESLTQQMFMEEDLHDHKKEEEERMLLEKEERNKCDSDNRSLKSHGSSNSTTGKTSGSRSDKKKKTPKTSSNPSLSSKGSKKDKDHRKVPLMASTQSTPTFHKNHGSPGMDLFDISESGKAILNHRHSTDNFIKATHDGKTYKRSGVSPSTHNKLERRISSPLSTNSSSPQSRSPVDSNRSRRSSIGNTNSSTAKTTKTSSTTTKPTMRRKTSQTTNAKKVDRNGHVR